MSGVLLAAELGRAVGTRASGVLEWRDTPKRRLYFFRAGGLVLVQSNLKSESPERITARQPELSAEALPTVVATTRLRGGLSATAGEVVFHPDVAPPTFEPIDTLELLWSVADAFPPLPPDSWPRSTPTSAILLGRLPVGAELVRYLLELDGSRPLEDVVEFGPDAPARVAQALALAFALGALDAATVGAATRVTSITSGPAPSVAGPAPSVAEPAPSVAEPAPSVAPSAALDAPVTVDDLADLIQGALDATNAASPSAPGGAAAWGPAEAHDDSEPPDAEPPPAAPRDAALAARFGGASATVTLGAQRPAAAPPPEPEPDPVAARFGGALTRIRGAQDHFAVLGTGWQDAPDTHRRAYLALAQRLHPDRLAGESAEIRAVAEELFEKLRAAWEVIGDDERRNAYIARTIRGEKTEDELAMEHVRRVLDAENDFKRGVSELNGGRLTAAADLLARAAAAVPEEVEFAAYAGYTRFRLAQGRDQLAADEGARCVAAALEANERLDGVWVLHGVILRMTGDEAGARRAFVAALKIKPSNPDAVREMKRLEREREAAENNGTGSFLSKLFGKK